MRSTSAGFRGPGTRCSSGACPGESWIASGPASTSVGDRRLHVLDPGEEGGLAEEAVVDGDVEALAVGGEEPVQARGHATTSSILGSPSAAPTASRRGGADPVGEDARPFERPALEAGVDHAGGEGVPCARRVDRLDAGSRYAPRELGVLDVAPVGPECDRDRPRTPRTRPCSCRLGLALARESARLSAAQTEHVEVRQARLEPAPAPRRVPDRVERRHNTAPPRLGEQRRRRLAVESGHHERTRDVQRSSREDAIDVQFRRAQRAVGAGYVQERPLARLVDQHNGGRRRRLRIPRHQRAVDAALVQQPDDEVSE